MSILIQAETLELLEKHGIEPMEMIRIDPNNNLSEEAYCYLWKYAESIWPEEEFKCFTNPNHVAAGDDLRMKAFLKKEYGSPLWCVRAMCQKATPMFARGGTLDITLRDLVYQIEERG